MVYRHKYITLILMLILTFAMASQIRNLTIDTRDESFFHDDDPILIEYNNFRDTFGQDDLFIIALKPEQGITRDFLSILFELHTELETELPYIDEVKSIVNGRVTLTRGDTLMVEELMENPPATDEEYERIMGLIDHYPLYEKILISPDRTLVSIIIKARAIIDDDTEDVLAEFGDDYAQEEKQEAEKSYLSNDQNVEIYKAIHRITDRYLGKGIQFYYAGTPAFVAEITKGIEKDLSVMMPLSILIIIVFLFVLFRRVTGVIYPLITVFFSLISTLAIRAGSSVTV